jgi:glycosyltransferase involved in cell wall biosynthesis
VNLKTLELERSDQADVVAIAPSVSVVVPTKNEAKNLPYVFARMPKWVHEVVLVDACSTDGTVEVARVLWPDVVVIHQQGKGKGNALLEGFNACTGEITVMLDADGSTDPAEIPRFVAALRTGGDFAKGTRFITGGGSADITPTRRLGNRVLSGLVNSMYKTSYTDLCYGYNAFWTSQRDAIRVDCAGFEVETLINIRIAKAGLKVVEVPSFEDQRVFGESNLNAVRDGFRVLRTIFEEHRRSVLAA